jgi:hypothetical protein
VREACCKALARAVSVLGGCLGWGGVGLDSVFEEPWAQAACVAAAAAAAVSSVAGDARVGGCVYVWAGARGGVRVHACATVLAQTIFQSSKTA